MRNIVLSTLLSCVLLGCASYSSFTLLNRQNLTQLQLGMTKEQVHEVMGIQTFRKYNNPYRTAMGTKNDEVTEVFYYWTDGTASGGIEDNELTPVVFLNGKVIGWGREFFSEYDVEKIDIRIESE